jgi:hypothetical protein
MNYIKRFNESKKEETSTELLKEELINKIVSRRAFSGIKSMEEWSKTLLKLLPDDVFAKQLRLLGMGDESNAFLGKDKKDEK